MCFSDVTLPSPLNLGRDLRYVTSISWGTDGSMSALYLFETKEQRLACCSQDLLMNGRTGT